MENITVEIEIEEEGYTATQEYSLENVYTKMIRKLLIEVYQSDNFFGHPVTLASLSRHLGTDDGIISIQLAVKAAVCSENDTFDPEHGVELVVGRLITMYEDEFDTIITSKGVQSTKDLVERAVEQKAADLCDYLLERDSAMMSIEMEENMIKQQLQKQFESFK